METNRYPPQSAYLPRRRSHQRFRYLDLPAELRLLIIQFSLPPVNDVSKHWPEPIPSLLRVSKQFHADTRLIMKDWSPMHYIPDPTYIHMIPYPGVTRVENICMPMFHDARIDILRSGPNTQTPANDHRELIQTWTNYISQLPRFHTIKTISIDATPAPGWLRYGKPSWLPNILNDKSVSDRFIYEHISLIANLMTNVAGFYNSVGQPVNVDLVGQYGLRSTNFPRFVQNRCESMDLSVDFTGTIVEPIREHDIHSIKIQSAIFALYSPRSIPRVLYDRHEEHFESARAHLINNYRYTSTSQFLFQNCFLDDELWTMHQLERLTDFAADLAISSIGEKKKKPPKYIDIAVPDFARGAFICSLAKDLHLSTSARNTSRRREIRIYKARTPNRTREWRAGVRTTTATTSFSIMDAAIITVGMAALLITMRTGR